MNLLRCITLLLIHLLLEVFRVHPSIIIEIDFLEARAGRQLLQFQEHVEIFQYELHVGGAFYQSVDHLFTYGAVHDVSFKHGQHHGDHVLLQIEQFFEQIYLTGMFGEFFLHVREEEQETAHRVPQSEMDQICKMKKPT